MKVGMKIWIWKIQMLELVVRDKDPCQIVQINTPINLRKLNQLSKDLSPQPNLRLQLNLSFAPCPRVVERVQYPNHIPLELSQRNKSD
jgi:hypothetical protein